MITINDKSKCCGCYACFSICPRNCIKMLPDEEGFVYPVIDYSSCIECGLCEKICPELHGVKEVPVQQKSYLLQNKDTKVHRESTAGGAFTAIAKQVIAEGGVVFGGAYDSKLRVIHTFTEDEEGLAQFRGSKYVQSNVGNAFNQVKQFLKDGRKVCFSGTPCQVEGLYKFLGKDYENLILVDFICKAVSSPKIFKMYLDDKRKTYGKITKVSFRDKSKYGYKYAQFNIYGVNGKLVYHNGIDTDIMLRVFFSNIISRPSCYDCSYLKRYRVSDFTMFDCFEPDRYNDAMNDDKGVTRLIVHSQKGAAHLDKIKKQLRLFEVSPDLIFGDEKKTLSSTPKNPKRAEFVKDMQELSTTALFHKYFPNSITVKAEKCIRILGCKVGFFDKMRRLYKNAYGDKRR